MLTTETVRERANVEERYRWNLTDLYAGEAEWRAARQALAARIPRVREYQGRLGTSATVLTEALDLVWDLQKEGARLYVYASMRADEDTRASEPQGMEQEMQQVLADLGAGAAFIEPELLRVGRTAIEGFLDAEPRLATYRFPLEDMFRRAAHTLSDGEERLLADAAPMASAASTVHGILSNADFPYPTITLPDGREVRVDQAGYAELRTSHERAVRQQAMEAFFRSLGGFSRTYGATLNASLQRAWFYARARKYGSTLEASLDGPNIPVPVYHRLVEGVNRHLPVFHRYLALRRRMLGVDEGLRYFDLYAPLVASVELRYTPDEAQALVLESLSPLGPEYGGVLRKAFSERWIDVFPTQGKRSGAYSNGGAYDVHPYILMNYLGQYNDVSTLTHELGHTMHSHYSNTRQPYVLSHYSTFVAEVASTFNEALLIDYVLERITDRPTRMSLLGSFLENIKATVFRQTQFAEFELKMHEMVQRGEAITGDSLGALYLDITRRYYGHEAGHCTVDDYIAHEWSYIPHFYQEFYVFQYATSFTASAALAEQVLAGTPGATDRYLTLLSSGSADYPVELLRAAGVDMTTDGPLDATIQKMVAVMDEMEALLAQA
ncbi:MAG: oligoendopeptidase F [Acidobacteria bacterium]|nr:oligoendopeptidase F [Acidobacteriota bacterium]